MKDKALTHTKKRTLPLHHRKKLAVSKDDSMENEEEISSSSSDNNSGEQPKKATLPPRKVCSSCGEFISTRTLCQACQKRKQRAAKAQMGKSKCTKGKKQQSNNNDDYDDVSDTPPSPVVALPARKRKSQAKSKEQQPPKPRRRKEPKPLPKDLDNVTTVADGLRRMQLMLRKITLLADSESITPCQSKLLTCRTSVHKTKRIPEGVTQYNTFDSSNEEDGDDDRHHANHDQQDEDSVLVSKVGNKRKRSYSPTDCKNVLAKFSAAVKSRTAEIEIPAKSSITVQKPARKRKRTVTPIIVEQEHTQEELGHANHYDNDSDIFLEPEPAPKRKILKKPKAPAPLPPSPSPSPPQARKRKAKNLPSKPIRKKDPRFNDPSSDEEIIRDGDGYNGQNGPCFGGIISSTPSNDTPMLLQTPAPEDCTYTFGLN